MSNFTFERYEIKYLLTKDTYQKLLDKIIDKIEPDKFGKTLIRSIYYDTVDDLLIRRSIEKNVYKEKLRIRTYGLDNKKVFLEIKKKYLGKVYKRRISLNYNDVNRFLTEKNDKTQIGKEIISFCNHYKDLKPKMLIMYERDAYFRRGTDLRITFDKNISYRNFDLNFNDNLEGEKVINSDYILMEIKVMHTMPIWLVKILSELKIYKTSFSKYGLAYKNILSEGKIVYGKNI